MARIRSIHPGLLTDEAFMTLTVEAPVSIVLLLGLWTEADDAGTFEWKPLTLKARILPALADRVDGMLDDLAVRGFIRRFVFDGKPYGVIRNFVKFQRPKSPKDVHPSSPDSREFAGFTADGKRPNATTGRKSFSDGSEADCDDGDESGNEFGTSSELVRNSFGTDGEISAQMEDGGGRREKEKEKTGNTVPGSARRVAPDGYAFDGKVVRLTRSDFDRWTSAYRHLELTAELIARDAYLASPEVSAKDRKAWFTSTSKYLANRNSEAGQRARAGPPRLATAI